MRTGDDVVFVEVEGNAFVPGLADQHLHDVCVPRHHGVVQNRLVVLLQRLAGSKRELLPHLDVHRFEVAGEHHLLQRRLVLARRLPP